MTKTDRIFLSAPDVGALERHRVAQVFDTNWIAPLGPEVDAFEDELARYCGRQSAAAVSSGTAAIHLALKLLGVQSGDTVVVPTFTFVATASPVTYLGAEPIFVDSEADTWNMCPKHLRVALNDCVERGKRPKAVIVVDLYGKPANYRDLIPVCQEFSIPVIEDAAEALGSYCDDKPAGSFGMFGILSFNGNKIITTSGGGALLCDSSDLTTRARFLATQARDPAPHYQHSEIGFNYRMSNVLAGIGRAQLEQLEKKVQIRRGHFERYRQGLEQYGVKFPDETVGTRCNRWLTTVLFPRPRFPDNFRETVRQRLESCNIEARPLWKPLHLQPVFKGARYFGDSVAQNLFDVGLCLPSGSGLTASQIDSVIEALNSIIAG